MKENDEIKEKEWKGRSHNKLSKSDIYTWHMQDFRASGKPT